MFATSESCIAMDWRNQLSSGTYCSEQECVSHICTHLVPVNDMNPIAIAESMQIAEHHVTLPMNALHDDKSVKQVNLRLSAGEITAVESQCEIFADHVTFPLYPFGRVIRKLHLTAMWTPDLSTCILPQLSVHVTKTLFGQGLLHCNYR